MPAGWEKAGLVGLQEGGTQIDMVTLGLVGESKLDKFMNIMQILFQELYAKVVVSYFSCLPLFEEDEPILAHNLFSMGVSATNS